jgi:hypothetical protein
LAVGILKDAGSGFTISYITKNNQNSMFSITTNSFTINVASIAVTAQPASAYQYASGSATVAPSITVSLRSSDGDNLDNASPLVSSVLAENAGSLVSGSVASSSQSATAAAGVTTFTYTVSLESGDSYRFSISSMTASVNSNIFAINPYALVVTTQPSSVVQYANSATSVPTGTAVVVLTDGAGNTLTGSSTDSRTVAVTFQETAGECKT